MDNASPKEIQRLIQRLSTDLAENLFMTINVLSNLVTMTERMYEGSHARFVSEKSAELARLLGMREEVIFQVKIAALLHDIGKVTFKDSALYKFPNDMTQNEYKQYMLHVEIGAEILKGHRGFDQIVEIMIQHHERLDGSGFPNHLKGNQIHPGAAIIGVVDTYHNAVFKKNRERLNSESEKTKFTSSIQMLNSSQDRHAAAVKYLTSKKGQLFDRKAVDTFITLMEYGRADMGDKIIQRIPVNTIEPGMVFAEDYYTSYGLLIASRGETTTPEMAKALIRFAENGDIPHKILVLA